MAHKFIPIYSKISESIKEDILNLKYPHNTFLPSERLLSEQYQAERTTIRRALQQLVDEGFICKLPGAGSKVILNANTPQSLLQTPPSICFILPGKKGAKISEPFMADLFSKLQEECAANGYNLIYYEASVLSDLPLILNNPSICAIVWTSTIDSELIHYVNTRNLPCICIANEIAGYYSINSDDMDGARQAVNCFVSHHHKRIAIINGISSYYVAQRRLQGYQLALIANSLSYSEEYVRHGDWSYDSGYEQSLRLFKLKNRPTAIFCANDAMALGAMKAAADNGICVPDELSVIGFDDIAASKYASPPLTTLRCNTSLLAKYAVNTIHGLVSSSLSPINLFVPVELVERGTVADVWH